MAVQSRPDLLVRGEHILGSYQLQVARRTDSGWTVTIPPLYALVTNQRLILWPQTRRSYPPASIPRNYVVKVTPVVLDHRNAVLLQLKTGHDLYLIVGLSEGGPFVDMVKKMLTPPLLGRIFKARVPKQDIQRLIQLIEQL
ncbi:MAG TPA: hypothetical protein VK003_02350 [Oceanobacillus sp.]|nr:hypothetical protein [Oceanobacillus sp.]